MGYGLTPENIMPYISSLDKDDKALTCDGSGNRVTNDLYLNLGKRAIQLMQLDNMRKTSPWAQKTPPVIKTPPRSPDTLLLKPKFKLRFKKSSIARAKKLTGRRLAGGPALIARFQ